MLYRILSRTNAGRLCLPLLIGCLLAPGAIAAQDNPDWYGVWWRGGNEAKAMKERCPWIKGVFIGMHWAKLEPRPGEFDWEYFESEMTRYADAGLYIQFMIWTGGHAPRWLYDHGVPEVETTPTINPNGVPHGWTYPHYMDPDYQRFYWRMIREVAAHLDKLPKHVRDRIICLQTAEGTTGDEGPYKGTPLNPAYDFSEEEWDKFKFETWRLFDELYRPKSPRIFLLINSGNQGQYHDWLMAHIPDTWRKAGNPGHGYQLNEETKMMAFLDPIINQPGKDGLFIRCRSEMDERHKGWFAEAPVWNQYWLNLWGLHFGLDIFQHETDAFQDPRDYEGYEIYDRYGGRKVPAESPGAFCALRDGLDAADKVRFPVKTYGTGELNPVAKDQSLGIKRTLAIVNKFAAYGAKQGDPAMAMQIIMKNRSATAMNDVGWEIWPGNYERYLTQIDPLETSLGWWRVGDQGQPYGRFARSTDRAAGRDTLYFDLNDQLADSLKGGVLIRVVYFDEGTGDWSLQYDGKVVSAQTALVVRKTNTGRWLEKTVQIDDARFKNGGPRNADLLLRSRGPDDTKFHLVEVRRQ
jgi:hypothetical protein